MTAEPWRSSEWWSEQYDAHVETLCQYASALGSTDPIGLVGDAFLDVARRIRNIVLDRLDLELLEATHRAASARPAEAPVLPQLDLAERAAVVLRIGLGRSFAEIATVLGTDEPTVRRLIRTAHDRLARPHVFTLAAR